MLIDISAMRAIREAELSAIVPRLPAGARILEIGGGSGWQAAALARLGFSVESVDVESNPFRGMLEWPVRVYDGQRLPFPSASFDVVFSSNVLEHVVDLEALLGETARVVTPSGLALHLVPTPQWRLLTFMTHYPWLAGVVMKLLRGYVPEARASATSQRRSLRRLLRAALAAPRHGEHGTALGELCSFRRAAWLVRLQRHGWRIEDDWGLGMTYSGYFMCYPWLGPAGRSRIAAVIGSSCHAYLLRHEAAQ